MLKRGEVVEAGEAFVFEPEEVEAGFVAGGSFFICTFAPAGFGVRFRFPSGLALVAVFGVVAVDELIQALDP